MCCYSLLLCFSKHIKHKKTNILLRDKQAGISVPYKAVTLKYFLDFCYTDSVNLPNAESDLPEILQLAKKWEMSDLVNFLAQQYL